MDSIWAFRSAYHEAREFKSVQDAFCQTAESGLWESLSGDFPDDLHLEMLVDVLRGKVKVINCSNMLLHDGLWNRLIDFDPCL